MLYISTIIDQYQSVSYFLLGSKIYGSLDLNYNESLNPIHFLFFVSYT